MKHILLLLLCATSFVAIGQTTYTDKDTASIKSGDAFQVTGWTSRIGPKHSHPKYEALRFKPFHKEDSLSCFVCKQAFKLGDSFVYYVTSQSSNGEIVAQFTHPKCAERHPRYKH